MFEQNRTDAMLAVDVLIIGAGPGGIAAAVTAAHYGKSVLLVDDGPDAGGQIWRAQSRKPSNPQAQHWLSRVTHANITRWFNTRFVRREHRAWYFADLTALRGVRATHIILATGAREIFLPFPGWTLPQVCGAGGLQALIKNGLNVQGQRIVIAGTGPLLLATADTAKRAGAHVLAIVEQANRWHWLRFGLSLWRFPAKWPQLWQLTRDLFSIPYWCNAKVIAAEGSSRVQGVQIQKGRQRITLDCDWLACAYGLQANTDLLSHLSLRTENGFVVVDAQQRSTQQNIFAVGELTGIGGVDKALIEGQIAALTIAGQATLARAFVRQRQRQMRFVAALQRFCALGDEAATAIAQDCIVCRCEDVRHQQLQNCRDGREARLYTRAGMGACQGRICGAVCEKIYGWSPLGQRPSWTALPVKILLQEDKP